MAEHVHNWKPLPGEMGCYVCAEHDRPVFGRRRVTPRYGKLPAASRPEERNLIIEIAPARARTRSPRHSLSKIGAQREDRLDDDISNRGSVLTAAPRGWKRHV